MKRYGTIKLLTTILFLGIGMNFTLNAQSYKLNNKATSVLVDGTSNIHDWTMKAESFGGTLTAEFDEGSLEEIEKLQFSVEAESLKSGKGGMDKNAYEALNTNKYKKISYTLNNVKSIEKISEGNFKVKTTGTLEIAGKQKQIPLNFNLSAKGSELILTGDYSLKMTDYGVEPPTAVFGTIKTGDTVKIKFETHFNK